MDTSNTPTAAKARQHQGRQQKQKQHIVHVRLQQQICLCDRWEPVSAVTLKTAVKPARAEMPARAVTPSAMIPSRAVMPAAAHEFCEDTRNKL
jgi:hypothetical protein